MVGRELSVKHLLRKLHRVEKELINLEKRKEEAEKRVAEVEKELVGVKARIGVYKELVDEAGKSSAFPDVSAKNAGSMVNKPTVAAEVLLKAKANDTFDLEDILNYLSEEGFEIKPRGRGPIAAFLQARGFKLPNGRYQYKE